MPANASLPTAPAPQPLLDQIAPASPRRRGRPVSEDATDLMPLVQRQISTASAPPLLESRHAPAFVFDLAQRPVELRGVMRSVRPTPSARAGDTLTPYVVRIGNVTRCTLVPMTETAEWAERKQARRARQRPPKSGQRKMRKAIARWGLFDGSME